MILSILVALDENQAIGLENQLPWRLPADLRFFRRTTMGKPILMGRKTYESLGKPLKGRDNLVLSRNPAWKAPEGVRVFADWDSAMEYLQGTHAEEAFVIGGAKVFERALPLADRLRITRVLTRVPRADTYFPPYAKEDWILRDSESFDADEENPYAYRFETYDRKK